METCDNEAGGKTVVLIEGDDLSKVPRSHRRQITASIREAFADPSGYYGRIAKRCPFQKMSKWLRALLSEDRWELCLNQGYPKTWTLTGFQWRSEKVRGATIGLPDNSDLGVYPAELQEYFSLVDVVSWNGFGCAGGLGDSIFPLSYFPADYHGDQLDLASTCVWGSSPCGDMLIYTQDGRGGWVNHGSHQIHLLGTIADTINWVYSELLADRCPQWNNRSWDRKG